MTKKYHGIIVPAITPLADPETIDLPAVKPLFDFMIAGGIHGIFILGSTGEGPALKLSEQKKLITESVKAIAGRVKLLVGISGASGAETLEMGDFAIQAGADAVVAALPCYIPATSEEEIINYYTVLGQRFPDKVFIYNMPALTKINIQPELAVKLLSLPGITGYKDSAGDFDNLVTVIKSAKHLGRAIFVGPEHLTGPAMLAGADGGVNGGANVKPEMFADIVKAVDEQDMELYERTKKAIDDFQPLYGTPCTCPSVIRSLKRELSRMGMIRNITAFPNLPLK